MVKTLFGMGLAAILAACSTTTATSNVADPTYTAFSAPTDPNPNEVRQTDPIRKASTTVMTSGAVPTN
jgi:hypothetical protein